MDILRIYHSLKKNRFLCFGSPPFFWHNYVHHFYYTEAFKRFKSQTFTRYTGSIPTISTIDPKIIKQVTIKQFNNFHMTFTENVKDKNKSLDISHGPLWKLLRKELTPVFTSGNQTTSGKSIKIKQKFHGLTLDVINSCAYGIKTNSSQDSDHELLKHAKKLLEDAVVTKNLPTSIEQTAVPSFTLDGTAVSFISLDTNPPSIQAFQKEESTVSTTLVQEAIEVRTHGKALKKRYLKPDVSLVKLSGLTTSEIKGLLDEDLVKAELILTNCQPDDLQELAYNGESNALYLVAGCRTTSISLILNSIWDLGNRFSPTPEGSFLSAPTYQLEFGTETRNFHFNY
ncbi:CYP6 [Lepeophtheirus salmonis]|uniref:CYP6 n=1 Tax=Lepeophtheirus salmonis TaxID=72036 RepID=A0A7R8D4N1_LEPSM|nr:CYP6 [Lepeophtheirus salmonis]CAF2996202.1 CYP6 [Lepeophtheirus salmonis]